MTRLFHTRAQRVEARQLGHDYDDDCEILGWCGGHAVGAEYDDDALFLMPSTGRVARPGDWIVKDQAGSYHLFDASTFALTFQELPDA